MSETNAPQAPDYRSSEEQVAAVATAYPQVSPPVADARPATAQRKLPAFLKVSIILLIGLTIASISLLFIGELEGRFERVFSTFALFATFVVLTAVDTSRERKNDWYAPVALIANTYILGLLLVVIWRTPYNSFSLLFEIVWKSIFVIVTIRLVIICCELLLRSGEKGGTVVVRFAFITSILAMLSGILFTAPTGVAAFELEIPDLYWKISTALLILTALGLSVTLLLRWAGKSADRDEKREAIRAAQEAAPLPYIAGQPYAPGQPYGIGQSYAAGQPGNAMPYNGFAQQEQQVAPFQPVAPQMLQPQAWQPQVLQPQPLQPQVSEPQVVEALAVELPAATPVQAEPAPAEAQMLPWPTFADGQPYPAGPDGQPDFDAAGVQPPQQ